MKFEGELPLRINSATGVKAYAGANESASRNRVLRKFDDAIQTLSERITDVPSSENPRKQMLACWQDLAQMKQALMLLKNDAQAIIENCTEKYLSIPKNEQGSDSAVSFVNIIDSMRSFDEHLSLYMNRLTKQQQKLETHSSYHAQLFAPERRPINTAVGRFDFGTFSKSC